MNIYCTIFVLFSFVFIGLKCEECFAPYILLFKNKGPVSVPSIVIKTNPGTLKTSLQKTTIRIYIKMSEYFVGETGRGSCKHFNI